MAEEDFIDYSRLVEPPPPTDADERAARNWQLARMASAPQNVRQRPYDLGGTKIIPPPGGLGLPSVETPPEAGAGEQIAAGVYNTAKAIPNFVLSPEGFATMLAPELLGTRLAAPLVKGALGGIMAKTLGQQAGKASVTRRPQDITEAVGTGALMAGGVAIPPRFEPSLEQVHAETPKITPGNVRVRLQLANGKIIPGLWKGYWEAPGTKFDKAPSVATLVGNKWSHGMLPPGATILEQVPTFEEWKQSR